MFLCNKNTQTVVLCTIYNWREVRCETMSNVIVKESITKNQVFVVRKNLKQLENVNIINVQ